LFYLPDRTRNTGDSVDKVLTAKAIAKTPFGSQDRTMEHAQPQTTSIALLADRAVLAVTGPDALPLLQGLLTNSLATDAPTYSGLLSPQGKLLAEMIAHPNQDGMLLDLGADRIDDMVRRLMMYRLRAKADIGKRPDLAVYAAPEGPVPDPRLAALWPRWIGPAGHSATLADEDYHRQRMRAGVPEGSTELGVDATLWLETNAKELHGVDFTKGCYIGQENTARMNYRNKVRRRLLPLAMGEAPDDVRVMAADKEAGTIRHRLGDVAIAWMRLEFIEAQAPLTVGGAPVTVLWPDYLG
jgi:tRNA-modifying protein YgfZ